MRKNIKLSTIIIYPLLIWGVVSCEKDNYKGPSSAIMGRVVDQPNGELVPQQTVNGGILRLFQTDIVANAAAITSYFKSDGTFENKMLFDGHYRVVADGPFFYDDTVVVAINHVAQQDIIVRPYLYVATEVISKTPTSAKIKVKVSLGPKNMAQKIARVGLVAGTTSSLDINFFTIRELTNTESVDNSVIVTTDYEYELNNLKPKTTYYIRGAARTINTGNYYNYAPVLTIDTD